MYSCQPFLELPTCCGKCCVSKLQGVAETQSTIPSKTPDNWRESNNNNNNSCERSPKDVGSKDKGDTHSGRGIGNNTTEVKRKSEDHTGVDTSIELIVISVLLGSARILRKVLEMYTCRQERKVK